MLPPLADISLWCHWQAGEPPWTSYICLGGIKATTYSSWAEQTPWKMTQTQVWIWAHRLETSVQPESTQSSTSCCCCWWWWFYLTKITVRNPTIKKGTDPNCKTKWKNVSTWHKELLNRYELICVEGESQNSSALTGIVAINVKRWISNSCPFERAEEALNPQALVVLNSWMTKCFIWSKIWEGWSLLQIARQPLGMKDSLCCQPRCSKGACQQSSFCLAFSAVGEKKSDCHTVATHFCGAYCVVSHDVQTLNSLSI